MAATPPKPKAKPFEIVFLPPDFPPAEPTLDLGDLILLGLIEQVYAIIASAVNGFAGFVGTVFKAIGTWLHTLWTSYVKVAINWILDHLRKFREWLKRTIKPILDRLEKIKKWYDQHILKQQLRTLQMIQSIRRFLGILRLFHVKWAARLDQALADVQTRIEQDIAFIRGTLNQLINTLDLVMDPTLLFRSGVLGGSLLSNLAAFKRIYAFGDNRLFTPSEQATIAHDSTIHYQTVTAAHFQNLLTTGPTPDDVELRLVCRQALADTTNSTPPTRGA